MRNLNPILLVYLVLNIIFVNSSFAELVEVQQSTVEFSTTPAGQIQPDEAIKAFLAGDFTAANAQAQTFLQEHPDSPVTHELLGAIALAQKDYAAAEAGLAKSLELAPDRVSAWIRYGQTALESGNPQIAAERFSKVVQTWPDLGAGHRNLALALSRQGKVKEALDQIEQALKLSEKMDLDALYLKASFLHENREHHEAEYLLETILKDKPDFMEAVLLLGIVKLELGKIEEASAMLDQVIAKDPKSPWARLGIAIIARAQGDMAKAEEILIALTTEQPHWTMAQFQLAETLLMQKKFDLVHGVFQLSERHSKTPVWDMIQAGWLFLKYGAKEQALEKAKSAVKDASENYKPAAYNLLVRAAREMGGDKQWETELKSIARDQVQDPFLPAMYLGAYYLHQKQAAPALEQFEKAIAAHPTSEDALMGQAQAYMLAGRQEEALAAGQKILEVQDSIKTQMFLAHLYEQAEKFERAEETYRAVIDANPDYIPAMQALSRMFEGQGQTKQAAEALVAKGELAPDKAAVLYFDLGQLYHRKEIYDKAIDAYRQSVELYPNQPIALNNLAFLLGRKKETIEEAIKYADQAYKLAPNVPTVMDTLGWLYGRAGKLDLAEELLEKAVSQDEKDSGFRFHLGYVYAKQGRKGDAIRELNRAVQGAPFEERDQANALLQSFQG